MKRVLIWGFYDQGNIGDDVMAAMLFEMFEEAGSQPVIFTANPRFEAMGYRTTAQFSETDADLVVLGGGAFFKRAAASRAGIEQKIKDLAGFIGGRETPVLGISLGSDGVSDLGTMSAARQAVVRSPHFRGAALRLKQDMSLGVTGAEHLPDVVLLTSFCSERYPRLAPIDPWPLAPEVLINLSRRSALCLPMALWHARRRNTGFFRAHTGPRRSGGEIALPGHRSIDDDRIAAQLGYLRAAQTTVSSKLHPGVIALSYGRGFEPIAPRPKTRAFLAETQIDRRAFPRLHARYMSFIRRALA